LPQTAREVGNAAEERTNRWPCAAAAGFGVDGSSVEEQETCRHLPSRHADAGRQEAERGGVFSK